MDNDLMELDWQMHRAGMWEIRMHAERLIVAKYLLLVVVLLGVSASSILLSDIAHADLNTNDNMMVLRAVGKTQNEGDAKPVDATIESVDRIIERARARSKDAAYQACLDQMHADMMPGSNAKAVRFCVPSDYSTMKYEAETE